MSDLKGLSEAAQEQLLSAFQTGNSAIIEGVRSWAETVESLTPENLKAASIPGLENVPTPTEGVELGFDFAQKMLDAQKDFASNLVEALSPAIENTAKPKAAAKS